MKNLYSSHHVKWAMLHVIRRGPITPLTGGYETTDIFCSNPHVNHLGLMGFKGSDPGEANLERGRSRSLLKVSSCRQAKTGVVELDMEESLGLVSAKWKKK